MRSSLLGAVVAVSSTMLLFGCLGAACSSPKGFGNDSGNDVTDGSNFGDTSLPDGTPACATGQFQAHQQPAAMLVVLQRSGSMGSNNKWVFAAQAVVGALDQNVFDTMTLGFMAAPSSLASSLCLGISVSCGVPAFPQVNLAYAGTNKSSASSGVRHDIKSWLATNNVDNSPGSGNPLYDAIQSGIGALQLWPGPGKRLLFVVTDGAISCESVSTRTNGYLDGNGCHDWENPNNIMSLVNTANISSTPIDTFIVGVPGSDSYDQTGVNYPPYHMRAALSDIAYAGSPANVPAGCTHTTTFAPTDLDPTTSCHFDMTQTYTSTQVANAIAQVRGKVLGCIFDLPQPDGGTIDPTKVNVSYAVGGGSQTDIYKRATPTEDCSAAGYCWDYTSNGTQVELYGKACTDVLAATDADVEITVGCATVVK